MLLQGVREVSTLAAQASAHGGVDPVEPTTVSQSAFDAARASSPNLASLPRAKRIAEQLGEPWREVLSIAHEPPDKHAHLLGRKNTEPEQDWLTDDYVAYVLKLVARRLSVSTVSPSQYRVERDAMFKADRKRWLHGGRLLIPNDAQIRTACGSWGNALALASLQARPKPSWTRSKTVVPTRVEVIERFYDHYGAQPSKKALTEFARANSIPVSEEGGRKWSESIAAWKQQRQARGLPAPQDPLPTGRPPKNAPPRPDLSRDVGAAQPGEHPYRKWSDVNACVAWVARYLEQLPAGTQSTKRGYSDWARQQDGAPGASIFDQHGGWNQVRAAAQAAILSAKPPSPVH